MGVWARGCDFPTADLDWVYRAGQLAWLERLLARGAPAPLLDQRHSGCLPMALKRLQRFRGVARAGSHRS